MGKWINRAANCFPKNHPQEEPAKLAKAAFYGFTLAELKNEVSPNEWEESKGDMKVLESFAFALMEDRQIRSGIVPERWTGTAVCRQCGTVAAPPYLDGKAITSCRWCVGLASGVHYKRYSHAGA